MYPSWQWVIFFQLPPISPATPLCFLQEEILKDLWNYIFEKVELTQIMRQKDDAVYAQMLNRLRVRKQTESLREADTHTVARITKCETQCSNICFTFAFVLPQQRR